MRVGTARTLALLSAFLLLGSARGEDAAVQIMPDAVKWRVYPLADGVQVSALYGGADKQGIYTLRVKMANEARLKIHTHPDTRMITVLSGKLTAGQAADRGLDISGDAAVLQMLVEVLPQVVAKASEPLSAVDKLTVISTDGAAALTKTVAANVAQ